MISHQVSIFIKTDTDIVTARQQTRELAKKYEFSSSELAGIAAAISELARNIVTYAKEGYILAALIQEKGKKGIMIVASDNGPGIPDISKAMENGYSTSNSLGLGLPGVKRLMDEFEIESHLEKGTKITAKKMGAVMSKQFNYSAIVRPFRGEKECGDQYLIKELNGTTLIAIADGLGHGEEAALAAKMALKSLQKSSEKSLIALMEKCNDFLKNTRGAVLGLLNLDGDQAEWLSIGNIHAVHWSNKNKLQPNLLPNLNGVVGMRMPVLRTFLFNVAGGDTLILATDGIYRDFINFIPKYYENAETIAKRIFAEYHNQNDDALLFVICFESSIRTFYESRK